MLLGLVQYVLGGKHLGNAGLQPASTGDPQRDRKQKRDALMSVGYGVGVLALLGILGAVGVIPVTATLVSNGLGWVLLGISVAVFSWLIFGKEWSPEERKRSSAVLVLFVASALFWASFEQAGSSLNLFAERATNRGTGAGMAYRRSDDAASRGPAMAAERRQSM